MANQEHLELVLKGTEAIRHWRSRDSNSNVSLDLSEAYLRGADLAGADLSCKHCPVNFRDSYCVVADLSGAKLEYADFEGACLSGANLESADLIGANLIGSTLSSASLRGANLRSAWIRSAKLRDANLEGAYVSGAQLHVTDLTNADLGQADLSSAMFNYANLSRANLSGANLSNADFRHANLNLANFRDAHLSGAKFGNSIISSVDLRQARGLEETLHTLPSHVSSHTLALSRGAIPDAFLQGCGLQSWEIHLAKLYDLSLTTNELTYIQSKIIEQRTRGPVYRGGVFISHSYADDQFIDTIYARLRREGVSVWLDRQDKIQYHKLPQVFNDICANDSILLVLSEVSTISNWIEAEIELAFEREELEKRHLLCPIALDSSWEAKLAKHAPNRLLWRKLKEKAILDFSPTADFEASFNKLLLGLKVVYPPKQT